MGEFGVSQSDLAGMVGRSRPTVANALRLLKLPDDVQDLVHRGTLSTGHARALLLVQDFHALPALARRAVDDDLSVRELEALARGDRAPERRPRAGRRATRNQMPSAAGRDACAATSRPTSSWRDGKGGRVTIASTRMTTWLGYRLILGSHSPDDREPGRHGGRPSRRRSTLAPVPAAALAARTCCSGQGLAVDHRGRGAVR
jgi:hypothetical protein